MRAVAGDSGIGEQWRIKNRNLQSGAVLWLRHSFARAFSGDSLRFCWEILCLLIASLTLAMTQNNIGRAESSAQQGERGTQPCAKLESWGFCTR